MKIRITTNAYLSTENVREITITTDSGTQYDIKEIEPDVLQIQQVDKNLPIAVFPIDRNTVEIT